jgi:copper homeostasis protein (lipoprotein)
MKAQLTALALACFLGACSTVAPTPGAPASLIFSGTGPCADCPGIATELSLWREGGPYADMGHFTLRESYVGRSAAPLLSKGSWTVLRGDAEDENATVYEIDPDKGAPRYFLKQAENSILPLDSKLKRIPSVMDLSLKLLHSSN